MVILYILIAILVVLALWVVGIYNKFIRLITRADEAWSDIAVQLKRRYDLIPNLVETAKGYASHEKSTFENVTKARADAIDAKNSGDPASVGKAENMLSGALKSLFAVSENYPDLKANTNFLELQRELSGTENKIQASRRFYNTNVRDLNISVDVFPNSIIASMFNFAKKEFFELEEGSPAEEPVKVDF